MKLDIVKNRFIFLALSAVLLLPGIVSMIYSTITYPTHTPLKVGIDYTGGTTLQYGVKESITNDKLDVSELSFILDSDFGISNRSGLHCAPLAHKTISTYPSGTVRLSIGYFNTIDEIKYTIESLNKINNLFT